MCFFFSRVDKLYQHYFFVHVAGNHCNIVFKTKEQQQQQQQQQKNSFQSTVNKIDKLMLIWLIKNKHISSTSLNQASIEPSYY